MVCIESGMYVRVVEMSDERAPLPRPLSSGFSVDRAYRVLGLLSASQTSEAYLILSNDRDELWFISNKHARSVGIARARIDMHVPLDRWSGAQTPFAMAADLREDPAKPSPAFHGVPPPPSAAPRATPASPSVDVSHHALS